MHFLALKIGLLIVGFVWFVFQVEMAYDLLVESALAGEENAMDEFADQCRIIADSAYDPEDQKNIEKRYNPSNPQKRNK